MSTHTFVVCLAVGTALLALWIYVRFPGLAPQRVNVAVAHVLGGLIALSFVPLATDVLLAQHVQHLTVVFVVVLPALTYMFLACLWMIRMLHGMLPGVR